MKKLTIAFAALAAAALGWLLLAKGEPDTPTGAQSAVPEPVMPREEQAAASAPADPDYRFEDLQEPDCDIQRRRFKTSSGEYLDQLYCKPGPKGENPYEIYGDAELLVMAYADAGAAEELGRRLLYQRELAGANEFMLRAVALKPDDISPLQYLGTQIATLRGDSAEARTAVAHAYVITRTASHFDPSITTAWVEPDLGAYQFTVEEIQKLDNIVEANLRRMRQVQLDVFGESTIGEAL